MRVEGLQAVIGRMKAIGAKYSEPASVIVGFTQNYAIYVHENLEAHHPVGKAKFLEGPARRLKRELGEVVSKAVKAGARMEQALLLAGLRLQREAQLEVPVDTAALKNSAFTCFERDLEGASAAAKAAGDVRRTTVNLARSRKKAGFK